MRTLKRACVAGGVALLLSTPTFASSGVSNQRSELLSASDSLNAQPPGAPTHTSRAIPGDLARPARPQRPADQRVNTLSGSLESSGTPGTFSADTFQNDLFTGAATAEIPIVVPAGTAGVAPKIALRYSSSAVDELPERDQAQSAGLGWILDVGGFILRDLKNSTATTDDTFKLVFGSVVYDLVLVDGAQNVYHTKDDVFVKIQYVSSSDSWVLTTKDGTQHRFGYNADSKAIARGLDLTTAITYKYLLDRAATTSGVAVQYAYSKQTATIASNGQTYDQAVYPAAVTWAYSGSSAIGAIRQVRFIWAPRSDWTDTSGSTAMSFFERDRMDKIEVSVGGSLIRRYDLAFDYSIDRDPSYTWGGGASGDLTLRNVTIYGADGASTLPPLTFAYTDARLNSASNGIGGTVTYRYERVTTSPLYSAMSGSYDPDGNFNCGDRRPSTTIIDPPCEVSLVGHIFPGPAAGTIPLYSAMSGSSDSDGNFNCGDRRPSTTIIDPACGASLVGHLFPSPGQGTVPLYSAMFGSYDPDGNYNCGDRRPSTTTIDPSCEASLVGHIYSGKVDRYRVTARSLGDGRGGTSTVTFSYSGLGLSSDGKEFRGHSAVRATDPLGHYTDTWFNQDDLLKGRAYHSQTRHRNGSLLDEVTNTWLTSTPYPGVTFARFAQTDMATCDDAGAECKTARQSFEYDAYGNLTRSYQWGDVAVSGDERDEYIDWAVDAATWLHLPKRTALYDSTGALLRERWLSYDGLGWGALGARGLLTREERRRVGDMGSMGNPVATSGYDGYGNRTAITDPRGCTATIAFESGSHTYPATVTTCLGHTLTFAYDARWGQRTGESDPNNQTTTYTYDVFGRLTKATGPLDTGSQYGSMSRVYEDFGNASAQRIVTYRTTDHGTASAIWDDRYFDGLGRVYLRRSQGPGSQIISREATFDSRGLVATQTAPHFSTEGAAVTVFAYDARGRQTQTRYPDGTSVNAAYAPGRITLTDQRNNVTRRFQDIHGQLIRVEEVNGGETYSTLYAYDAAGALVRVTNHLGHVTTLSYDLLGRKTVTSDPNTGTSTYGYEPGGNLLSQTDARNQTVAFTYDMQGRVLTKTSPPDAQVTWSYDDPAVAYSQGRVTRIEDAVSATTFTYDPVGRVTQTQRLLDGTTYTMSRSYNALGRVVRRVFPDGDSVNYTYNEAGWLASVPPYISGITYNARGQQTQQQYANGVTTTLTYDPTNFRPLTRSTTGPTGSHQNLTYGHDPAGNITWVSDAVWTASRNFTYDALNRLTSANGTFGAGPDPTTENYDYNAIGDVVEKAGVLYAYGDPLHPSAVTSRSDGPTYTYDASGNILTSAGRTLAWDADNRLTGVTLGSGTTTFAYDPAGARVRKTTSAGVTRYPFPGYEVDPYGVTTKYLGGVAKKSTGVVLFYHNDHLGGVNVVTDASGARVQLEEYDPWGQESRAEGTADPTHRFTGKELDPETGLYYYGGRYYDATLGRFVSADPFVPAPTNPQSLNRYGYVINNPANLIDPSGFSFLSKLFKSIRKWARGHEVMSITMGLNLMSIPLPEAHAIGITMLAATPNGSLALASGIIAGTAVATFYCGGCGAAVGALVGELVGLYSAKASGGDVLSGVVVGGAAGAVTGYLGGYIGSLDPEGGFWLNVGSWAVKGGGQGIASGYAGGRGSLQSIAIGSAIGSATAVVLNSAYYGMVEYDATFEPGGAAKDKLTSTTMPCQGCNNVAFADPVAGSCDLCEGAPFSRAMNRIPGINATAGFHDALLVRLELGGLSQLGVAVANYPTILPSAALSYGALTPGVPATAIMDR
ncbi:MAG: hypothetical protein DME04_19325 [Candidatus Rokuibacteriota bacterium]|nr:MAG: hypothetical protein DME04_19325 [Candidatus Rokubacteria bacterium]